VTVSCAEGDTGFIYEGQLPFEHKTIELARMPEIPVKIMMNVGNPDRAFAFAATPNAGIGLARLEFIINNMIGIHPKALLELDRLPDDLRAEISPRIAACIINKRWFITAAAMCCLTLAAAFAVQVGHGSLKRFVAKALAPAEKIPPASRPASTQQVVSPQSPVAEASATGMQPSALNGPSTYVQRALADYAAGRLDSARETFKRLSAPGRQTPTAAQARQMLSMLDEIQQVHAQALKAQVQKKFTRALEYWDRLLALDSKLIGDRPSYFAIQAEQRVQRLSYDYALDALRQKNPQKARQLCQVILQINPQNRQALALLSKIESMT